MNAHTLEALGFDRICSLLAARAASVAGKERALRCAPCEDPTAARRLLDGVEEAVALQIEEPAWRALAFPDPGPALERAGAEGAVLEPAGLVAVAEMLRVSAAVAGLISSPRRARREVLGQISAPLLLERDFPLRVDRAFEPSGEVRDDASPALRAVRRELQHTRQSASARLESLSEGFRASGEDSFVSLRAGRYVLSVAAAEKRRLRGIVHDRSATGKTVYLEPLELVEMNNTLAELEADERAEIHRILREMTAWVRGHLTELRATLSALAELDELDARARLARELNASRPAMDERANTLRIVQGRHPLLCLTLGARTVPLDLTLEGATRALVVSGPNMGGKTVVLKTVGLLTLMGLAGLFVPAAEGTVLPWTDEIHVDIGDEQSLDTDLSTYAARLRNMKAALEGATRRSLVLLDELGAGTDPAEGAALGQALLAEVGRRGAFCVATTHLGAFKAFAAQTAGFGNAAMEYDAETLRPNYRLREGVPGRSHAFELARREGWPAETLAQAAEYLPAQTARADTLLEQIEHQLAGLTDERAQVAAEKARLEADREEYRRLAVALKEKMAGIRLERALEEDRRLRELRRLLGELRARIAQADERGATATAPAPEEARRWLHEREREVSEHEKLREPLARPRPDGVGGPLSREEIVAGRRVFARSLGLEVVIIEGDAGGKRVWVKHRGVRVALPAGDLLRLPEGPSPSAEAPAVTIPSGYTELQEKLAEQVGAEIDLRGLTREECLERLDLYLDRAALAGYPSVRIIHGKGTGALHREVQSFLRKHRAVRGFRGGEIPEGGWGVTIAQIGPEPSAGDPKSGRAKR